jgi:F0F1-type ATP synthase membrane subunit c/vacuolar-type H+-ATPase subunit K
VGVASTATGVSVAGGTVGAAGGSSVAAGNVAGAVQADNASKKTNSTKALLLITMPPLYTNNLSIYYIRWRGWIGSREKKLFFQSAI